MTASHADAAPRVFLLNAQQLPQTRSRIFAVDDALNTADQKLLEDAEAATGAGPFSVMDKQMVPPSGDRHDYLSHGTYWWPDPDSDTGQPFIRKDGEANPERETADYAALSGLIGTIDTLGLAYYFSDLERFAEHAALLLRTWFLDPATRMNPHLQYAQGIPGRCEGRGIGIIDTAQLPSLLDAVGLIGASSAWSVDDQHQLQTWCGEFLHWLVDSDYGRDEATQPNNHGTWYDAQVLALALFSGDHETGLRIAAAAPARLEAQIQADGSQPFEQQRTKSLDYATMNLLGFCDVADLCVHYDVDLWHHRGPAGQCLEQGVRYLVEAAIDSAWLHAQIAPFDQTRMVPLLRRAALTYGDDFFEARLGKLRDVDVAADRTQLLYPAISG